MPFLEVCLYWLGASFESPVRGFMTGILAELCGIKKRCTGGIENSMASFAAPVGPATVDLRSPTFEFFVGVAITPPAHSVIGRG